jgi:putative two-component system response regulator
MRAWSGEEKNVEDKRLKVLLIDDNPGYVQIIKNILGKTQDIFFSLESRESLTKGITRLSEGGIDILLINLNLPDSRSFNTFRRVRSKFPELPVVVLNDIRNHETAMVALKEGAQDYLVKSEINEGVIVRSLHYAYERKWIEEKLKGHQRELEARIQERTAELVSLNERLRSEIEERKWAQTKLRRSLEQLNRMLDGTVKAFSTVIESRDPYTAGHQLRVAHLAVEIARKMDLSENVTDTIYYAGVLHDIGKIKIPVDILNKPGKLSEIEMSLIRTHPLTSYEILKIIPFPFNSPIADVVLQHHESLDGSGYPHGLMRDQILLEARILKVADVVESMSSSRPYRPSLGIGAAIAEIIDHSRTRYDPAAVEACVKLLRGRKFFPNFSNRAGA